MSDSIELTTLDRDTAVANLTRRLSASDFRAILDAIRGRGRRRKTVEWIVAELEHRGSRGRLPSKLPGAQLPPFLVDLLGPELLSVREARYRLARSATPDERDRLHEYPAQTRGRSGRNSRARAISERRWEPGKSWPRFFVQILGFPEVFAGIPGSPSEADTIDVEPFRPLPDLEDFQLELKDQLIETLSSPAGSNRGILTLPTGAGKTRTAVEALLEWRLRSPERPGLLWIAQSEELCEQAVQAFREVWIDQGHRDNGVRESMRIHRIWGADRSIPSSPQIVVGSIQKLHAIVRGEDNDGFGENRCERLRGMSAGLGAVLVDEAHRTLAPSYGEVLEFLGIKVARGAHSSVPLIGLTATPYRSLDEETRRLALRFHGRLLKPASLGEQPVARLRERGVLSRPVHQVMEHSGASYSLDDDAHYADYFERFKDFHPDLLARLGQERVRNRAILETLESIPEEWPTLLFGCSVEHAKAMAVLLRRRDRSAATITGETRGATRRFLIEEFRAGRVSVLSNYGVLTTGFDAPAVRAVVIARPTASPVLYEQMIGRGMRGPRFGGTEECLVIDVEDNIQFGGQMAFARYVEYWEG